MDAALEREVWQRAGGRCEYRRIPRSAHLTPFQIDHVIALKHRGATVSDNLAIACFPCNSFKGPNIASIDTSSGSLTRLFHPRTDAWDDHFVLRANGEVHSETSVGRATILCLNMNEADLVTLRALLIEEGLMHPSATR